MAHDKRKQTVIERLAQVLSTRKFLPKSCSMDMKYIRPRRYIRKGPAKEILRTVVDFLNLGHVEFSKQYSPQYSPPVPLTQADYDLARCEVACLERIWLKILRHGSRIWKPRGKRHLRRVPECRRKLFERASLLATSFVKLNAPRIVPLEASLQGSLNAHRYEKDPILCLWVYAWCFPFHGPILRCRNSRSFWSKGSTIVPIVSQSTCVRCGEKDQWVWDYYKRAQSCPNIGQEGSLGTGRKHKIDTDRTSCFDVMKDKAVADTKTPLDILISKEESVQGHSRGQKRKSR